MGILYREHRGMLDEAMKTVVNVPDRERLIAHIRATVQDFVTCPITDDVVCIEPYGYDARIGWDTHIVTIPGQGVLGFTNGPVA